MITAKDYDKLLEAAKLISMLMDRPDDEETFVLLGNISIAYSELFDYLESD